MKIPAFASDVKKELIAKKNIEKEYRTQQMLYVSATINCTFFLALRIHLKIGSLPECSDAMKIGIVT